VTQSVASSLAIFSFSAEFYFSSHHLNSLLKIEFIQKGLLHMTLLG